VPLQYQEVSNSMPIWAMTNACDLGSAVYTLRSVPIASRRGVRR
jgi:hypothetical protein